MIWRECDAEKGCPTYFTLLCFVLELLILKAKYGWSDCSFDDLYGSA